MKGLAHSVKSSFRIYHYHLRCLEGFAFSKCPLKSVRMDSHQHTGGIIVIHLSLRKKIAAVHQTESVNLSLELVCIFTGKRKERVELIAAASTHTVNALDTVIQLMSSHMTLSCPHTGKIDHLIILVRQIKAETHCI